MPIDIEALRKKVASLKGEDKKGVGQWRPELPPGEKSKTYEVRLVPFSTGDTSSPCRELYFYNYDIMKSTLLTLESAGQPDPVKELIQLLRKDYEANKEVLKKLYPKMYAGVCLVARNQEDKGVQMWKISRFLYKRILDIILDADWGDVTDPVNGHDLKVTIEVEPNKFFNGKPSTIIGIDPKVKSTPLSTDKELAKKWLASVPEPESFYERKSYAEVKALIDAWLSAPDSTEKSQTPDTGEQRGGKSQGGGQGQPGQGRDSQKDKKRPEVEDDLDAAFAALDSDKG